MTIRTRNATATACDKTTVKDTTLYHVWLRLVDDACSEYGFKFIDLYSRKAISEAEIVTVAFIGGKWHIVD